MRLAALVSSCVLLLSASGLSQAPSPAAAQPSPAAPAVSFGILREDTVLIPFAVHASGEWTTPWPDVNRLATSAPARQLLKRDRIPMQDVPSAWWLAGEPARAWELLRASGDRHPVDVTGARRVQSHCTSVIGLATGYTSPIVIPRDTYPPPYAGVTSTQRGLLQPVVALTKRDAEFQAVRRELPALFQRYERRLASGTTEVEPDRDGSAPRLVAVQVAFLADGQRLIHFEAERVRRSQDVSVIDGWYTRAAGASGLTVRDIRSTSSDADGKARDSFTPLAAVVLDGRTYWLGPSHGYEWESYVVYDVTDARPKQVVSYGAGGC